MIDDTNPDPLALCVMLAQGDHAAGLLLYKIRHWAKYGKAEKPGVEGTWRANDKPWWMREARLSSGQYDRAIAKLKEYELVEKCQYWFGPRNIGYVRLSSKTRDFLTAATTWDVAFELLAQMGLLCSKGQAPAGTQIKPSLQEMMDAWGAPSLKPEEIGALAEFRQRMKSITYNGASHDCNDSSVALIEWAVANWGKAAWLKYTDPVPKTPQIEFFSKNFGFAIATFVEAEKMKSEPAEAY